MKKKIKRLFSLLILTAIVITLVPVQPVQASEANYMAAQMINFFKTNNSIADVNTLSPDEIRVYSIFLSNFMKPGIFTIEDLNKGTDSDLVKQVARTFFGSTDDTATLETIASIHKIIYNTIVDDLKADDKCTLYAEPDSEKALTGKQLLNKMMTSIPKDDKAAATIYFGPEKKVCMDLSQPAVRGAFKILAAYSVDYTIGTNGIAGMSALYIDGFGNIWGAFDETLAVGDREITTNTAKNKLKLVMPACLNPLSFTSFADSRVNGSSVPTQDSLKLPLNNAFAMGAFVQTSNMSSEFAKNIVPYYNIYGYFENTTDLTNLLNIFGISSPLESVLNSDKATTDDLNYRYRLNKFFSNNLDTIYPDSTYIVLANNMGNVEKTLENVTQKIKGVDSKGTLVDYLYNTMRISLTNVADNLYYFGESGQSVEWKDDFKDLGMLGASLFTDTSNKFYNSNATTNGITSKLYDFYSKLGNSNITDLSTDLDNMKELRSALEIFSEVFPDDGTSVYSIASDDCGPLMFMLSQLDTTCSNYDSVLKESESYSNKGYPREIQISSVVSAFAYLIGASMGENSYSIGYGYSMYEYHSPKLFDIGDTKAEVPHQFGLKDADSTSFTKLTTDKWALFNLKNKKYIYAMTDKDSKAKDLVVEDSYYITSTTPNAYNQLFTTFDIYTLFSSHNVSLSSSVQENKITFKIGSKDATYSINNFIADETNNWPGIFFGYMVDILQMDKASKVATDAANDGESHFDCYSFESDFLPSASINVTGGKLDLSTVTAESGLSNSDQQTMEDIQKDLVKKIYGIVSDTSNDYRNKWLKSTIDGFLLTIHRNITGSWLSNMSTVSSGSGSTYQGVVGFIHTPSLNDLPFTAWIMKNYMQVYVLALLIIAIFLIFMVLLRMRTFRQATAIFLFMCVALLLPNILLGNTINITNKVTDSIYSDKFDFWAMTQHQQSLTSLEGLAKGSKEETIANTMEKAEEIYSGDAGVRIKWMAPKKSGVFNSLYSSSNMSDSFATNLTIFKWLFSSFIYESEYVSNEPLATYLYRPYNSIVLAGSEYYAMGEESLLDDSSDSSDAKIQNFKVKFKDKDGKSKTAKVEAYQTLADVYTAATKSEKSKDYTKMFYAALVDSTLLKSENNFIDIYYSEAKILDIDKVGTWNQDSTNASVALWGMGSKEVNSVMFSKALKSGETTEVGILSNLGESISPTISNNDGQKIAFLLNTESPYYFFYNTLKQNYSGEHFKNALLDKDIFKVRDTELTTTSVSANGKVRDFLDLEGLFTYMIPYLTACNDYVYDWTSINGTSVSSYNFEAKNDKDDTSDDSYIQANRLKNEMNNVWNMYSSWVDQLNSLDVYNKKVSVGTKSVRVENTLNPSYYLLQGRPMIFSEADMIAKGYTTKDLTDVERRIQKVLDDTYEDLHYLVNYYDLDDEVLLSAAAMYATFNFNKEFSQTDLIGDSVMLYPQNFEMKNFNHDAFLRLALLNSTGESIFGTTDLFERIMDKTSLFTGILLLIEDVTAVILIPALKLILLLMLLFLGLLVSMSCVLTPPEKIVKTIFQVIGIPTGLFMISSIVFAWIISLLVGDGLTAYVGSNTISIATNDPTITVLLLIVSEVIYIIVLCMLIKKMFDSYKSFGMASIFAGVGLIKDLGLSGVAKAYKIAYGGVSKTGEIIGNATNTAASTAVGGIFGGKDGALHGLVRGLKGKRAIDTLDNEIGKMRKDKAMQQSGVSYSVPRSNNNPPNNQPISKPNVTSSIDAKATSFTDAKAQEFKEPKVSKDIKPKVDSTALGRVLSVPLKMATSVNGGVKIAGEAIKAGAHMTNVGARVGAHFTKEGAKVVGQGTVAGVKIAGKTVGKAYDYVEERGVGGLAMDGAKLAGKGAIAVGKATAKPIVSTAKATGKYAYKSAQDAVALNKDLSDKMNTAHNNLYKQNHGYDLDIANKASGKTGDRYEQEKAQKIKQNFDNKNPGRTKSEAWEIINKLESKRK